MIKINLACLTLILSLLFSTLTYGAEEQSSGIVDDSIRDFSIVVGSGAAGAVLGLSTLSFVDEPSKHFKNVAVGGAIGIVMGVVIVVVSQASRSTTTLTLKTKLNQDNFLSLSKKEFASYKIADNYLKQPGFGYQFSF